MINVFEKDAKLYFNNKKYSDCLQKCFQNITIKPDDIWCYELAGYCYMNLKMFSQSRGCFNTALHLTENQDKKYHYKQLIDECYNKESNEHSN